MDDIFMIFLLISFTAMFVFVILSLIQFAKRDKIKGMKQIKFAGVSLLILIISFVGVGTTTESTTISNEDKTEKIEVNAEVEKPEESSETEEERKAREQKEAEIIAEQKAIAAAERAKAEEDAKAKAEAKAKEESIPREYKSALRKAELYAETMHMSKAGVYEQLTSEYGEGFPKEAAQYAIDNIVFDWKEAALKKAQTYAETMAMSDSAIYDQLISEYGEKFTPEEAKYAIDNLE
ncbi:Ltp family lipoprotein [Solibacillus sp. FSL W8-0474]|uniref:Ltp family lipoprotein n=1 Tax=Solibacillus sp. FSL W8-0474 TaxID=2975336 RepID=UPI0030F786BB